MEKSILNGKVLVALGDSLFHGNKLGNGATWINKLGKMCGMTVYNHGINGNTLALNTINQKHPPMCVRYADMEDDADYVVVIGGANDKRLCVPVGENGDTDIGTFKGALNTLIKGLTEKYPKAKILFMTNYARHAYPSDIGLCEIEYVNAMIEICANWAIPCFDNYHNSGICFANPAQQKWIDEGISLGIGPNFHFSDEAYTWLLPKYKALLEAL